MENRQIEALVNQRVADELKKVKSAESEMGEKLYVGLVEQQTEKSAVESQQDIETMIERIKR
jgi:phosphate uptake regulator